QQCLAWQAAGITGEAAVTADHPMAGNDDGNRVGTIGGTDSAHRLGSCDLGGEGAVAAGLAKRDGLQRLPNGLLKRGALRRQAHFEALPTPSEILIQLPA